MEYFIKAQRGLKRLTDIASLPVVDKTSFVKYEGSISKCGDNADWDWGMYQDENNEWVLMEADGPGCIFNFTQHRYPTSPVPTFRFYFDNSDAPQFEIKPSEFGEKNPFIKPLADKFVGPEDNGRGPIWVVRSFVPMEFTKHCKVTSDIKLEGAEKDKGEGGWGHITYHLYDTAEGLSTFNKNIEISKIAEKFNEPVFLGCDETKRLESIKITPSSRVNVLSSEKKATLTKIGVKATFSPELLKDLWINIEFDNEVCVNAPFGTFFGCEYGNTPAKIETALLTIDNINGVFENRYPMPFFEGCNIYIENKSEAVITLSGVELCINNSLCYDKETTMPFRSSNYYEKTQNIKNKNSIIADIYGCGSMVYGVVSGTDIACGCEGDVRVFIDGVRSPIVESDGTESWGSYGWGFVCPPQCNPFSAYNGVPDINDTWSELRLTITDNYPFRDNLRFELEHGCQNDGKGFHSGQIFYYGFNSSAVIESIEIKPESEHYATNGKKQIVKNRFENGIHERYLTFTCVQNATETTLDINIPPQANALVLKRVCLQTEPKMEAEVYINNVKIRERNWFSPDSNTIYSWFEDDFIIPKKYIENVSKAAIKIVPKTSSFNDCGYKIEII